MSVCIRWQRTRLGSEQGALLGALNKPYKFTPEMFDVWSRLLREIPSAKLVVIQYKCAVRSLCPMQNTAGVGRMWFVTDGVTAAVT